MTRRSLRLGAAAALALAGLSVTLDARASSALEYPDNWVAQLSRGGAWLADASSPVATFYNPATLVLQKNSIAIGANFPMQKICFSRRGPGDTPVYASESEAQADQPYPQVCNEHSGFPRLVPVVAGSWRITERWALGLAVVPPSSYGTLEWPVTSTLRNASGTATNEGPSAQRFLNTKVEGMMLFPTLSVAYAATETLRFGAGFVAGTIPSLTLQSVSMSQDTSATANTDTFINNSLSTLDVADLFVPGFVVSAHWSPSENIDLTGWYKWLSRAELTGDLDVLVPLYSPETGAYQPQCEGAATKDCSKLTSSKEKVGANDAHVSMTLPMEVRLGARYHVPREPKRAGVLGTSAEEPSLTVRDPLNDDLFDVELDLSWADNSAASAIEIHFDEVFAPNLPDGTTLTEIPPQTDRPTGWKDSFGARLGGQYNVLPRRLGVRAGTWIESPAVDAENLNVTGVPALRGGVAGGVVLRFGAVDLEAGYMFVWNAGLDNEGVGDLHGIVSTNKDLDYKSRYAVNGGHVQQHANIMSVGGVVRF